MGAIEKAAGGIILLAVFVVLFFIALFGWGLIEIIQWIGRQ